MRIASDMEEAAGGGAGVDGGASARTYRGDTLHVSAASLVKIHVSPGRERVIYVSLLIAAAVANRFAISFTSSYQLLPC
jgi:hypothetical protein